jgi:hypothetical protein
MKIGYSVQGSTDRAFLRGLQQRWCPNAEMVEGLFRGVTRQSLRREYAKICDEFAFKSVDVMVFLTDADDAEWRKVKENERSNFPRERLALAIHGVADRNIECWFCADPEYVAQRLGIPAEELRVADPKGRFESAMGIDRSDRKEVEITSFVKEAPLHSWLGNPSFEDFYEQARDMSQLRGCKIENIRHTGTP